MQHARPPAARISQLPNVDGSAAGNRQGSQVREFISSRTLLYLMQAFGATPQHGWPLRFGAIIDSIVAAYPGRGLRGCRRDLPKRISRN